MAPVGRSPQKHLGTPQDLPTPTGSPPKTWQASDDEVIRETPIPEERPVCNDHDSTPEAILTLTREVIAILNKQNTSGQPLAAKKEAISKLEDIVSHLEEHEVEYENQCTKLSNAKPDEPHTETEKMIKAMFHKMENMEKEVTGLRREITELKTATIPKSNTTWNPPLQAVNPHTWEPPNEGNRRGTTAAEAMERKQQRDKYTLVITAKDSPEATKSKLKTDHPKNLIQDIQKVITLLFHGKEHTPKIHSINKRQDDTYKLHCQSDKDPQLLESVDWDKVLPGTKVNKRKYGIVVHGVPKVDVDPTKDDQEMLTTEIKEDNESRNLSVVQVLPLRRTQKHLNRPTAHHSLVIFTHSKQEADNCIKRGIALKGRFYTAEKYTPELNIAQCFNCYKFGHLAKHCKNEQTCGKCGEKSHSSSECPNNENKCAGCGGPHPAWHPECNRRDEEGERLRKLRQTASDRYST